eukprot:CAMPEP_0178419096 /NCGR_PEP_ID=MMETSP0689_2-20121128/25432_1 /TAXON_ID=160604 /ORGANISM="Amphidinium massartii, Strain CS-259" /LENGTH=255 /DNA_ID=CAMNT_0020040519 /DNA_START=54 /DNA_END=822 /DNA_ORIENTATION=-
MNRFGGRSREASDASWFCAGSQDDIEGPSALNRCQSPDSMYFDPPDTTPAFPSSSLQGQVSAPMNYGASCGSSDMLVGGGFANVYGAVMGNMEASSSMGMPGTSMVAVPAILLPGLPRLAPFVSPLGMRMSFGGMETSASGYSHPMEASSGADMSAGAKFTRRASRAARASEQTNKTRKAMSASNKAGIQPGSGQSQPASAEAKKAPPASPIKLGAGPSAVIVDLATWYDWAPGDLEQVARKEAENEEHQWSLQL